MPDNLRYPSQPPYRNDNQNGPEDMYTSEGPMDFDSTRYTQAGLPHLMAALHDAYRRQVQNELLKRKAAGQKVRSLEEALQRAPYAHFLAFCERYLSVNRPVETFAVDMNVGMRLSNNQRVCVSPGHAQVQGMMQDSGAVQVTHGRSQPGLDGVVEDSGGIPII